MLVYQSGEVAQTAQKECRHFSVRHGWIEQTLPKFGPLYRFKMANPFHFESSRSSINAPP